MDLIGVVVGVRLKVSATNAYKFWNEGLKHLLASTHGTLGEVHPLVAIYQVNYRKLPVFPHLSDLGLGSGNLLFTG